ncbi:MAG TPA: hypothetical protein VMH80_14465 [Bryobacteraceae bacterium]|nr:hypothetical protein [Bryobacteraceae bacterium]
MKKQIESKRLPAAVVMNMFYTGLGIARSLGERGIRVIGLSAHRGVYGNFTRYADIRGCPDSREDPEGLEQFLLRLGEELDGSKLLFPTRDDDVLFLERRRDRLGDRFMPVLPSTQALTTCLDKWATYKLAQNVGVPVPETWKIETLEELLPLVDEIHYPCVMKPLSAHFWRKGDNWKKVGARKAICLGSAEGLIEEYKLVAAADPRVVIQEVVPGGDDQLFIAACYMDRSAHLAAAFTAQKVLQVPEGFGTGCIVQTADRPELIAEASGLLQAIRFSGIAEVEFKWDAVSASYKLIEINPRPWDQHRLGHAAGVDLIYAAYCDFAGLAVAPGQRNPERWKWVAEDVLLLALLRSLWRRDGRFWALLRLARGKKIYAIWSASDPLPSIVYTPRHWLGSLAAWGRGRLRSALGLRMPNPPSLEEKTVP